MNNTKKTTFAKNELNEIKEELQRASAKTKKTFLDPSKVFYLSKSGTYFVDNGSKYLAYGDRSPVKAGIKRYLEENPAAGCVESLLADIQLDQTIDWTGNIAGYKRGAVESNGCSCLVLEEAQILAPQSGECPMHISVIEQAFPNKDARNVFLSWLRDGVRAIRLHCHHPAPMFVLAGQRNAGKSLLAHITQQTFGGRASNPMATWKGKTLWNDDLLGKELLLIDDSEANTDIRSRRAFGANFKESIYGGNIKIQKRNSTAMDFRPVWRVMVCCNETPENLSVIPPLEDGIEDKIILTKVSPITTPMPASSSEERLIFEAALQKELPAFLAYLEKVETPKHLQDSRDGVVAWKDQQLLESLQEISPEKALENLMTMWLDSDGSGINSGESKFMSAAEITAVLTHYLSPTRSQADALLKYPPNCGRYLSKLLKLKSPYVVASKTTNGTKRYEIKRPKVEEWSNSETSGVNNSPSLYEMDSTGDMVSRVGIVARDDNRIIAEPAQQSQSSFNN